MRSPAEPFRGWAGRKRRGPPAASRRVVPRVREPAPRWLARFMLALVDASSRCEDARPIEPEQRHQAGKHQQLKCYAKRRGQRPFKDRSEAVLGRRCGCDVDRVANESPAKNAAVSRSSGASTSPAATNGWAEGNGESANRATPATARLGPPATASRPASRFAMRSGESRSRNRRLPYPSRSGPLAAASAPMSTSWTAARFD